MRSFQTLLNVSENLSPREPEVTKLRHLLAAIYTKRPKIINLFFLPHQLINTL